MNKKINYKPIYHFSIEQGWMNDPNGCIFANNEFHIFFQYNPYAAVPEKIHWGHITTIDFLHYKNLGIALEPNMPYENVGCWSGSSVLHNGHLFLLYTSNGNGIQQQSLAVSTNEAFSKFEKYKENPVIRSHQLPKHSDILAFRDPYIFKEKNVYYALLGARDTRGYGKILLYKTLDLIKWNYAGVLFKSKLMGFPGIFECPSIKKISDKYLLCASINFIRTKGHRYQNFASTVATIGDLDLNTGKFKYSKFVELDNGFDYYAPQIISSSDDRIITISWMQMWERTFATAKYNWVGSLSLPREITIKNKAIYQFPVKEILDQETTVQRIERIDKKGIINLSPSCHLSFDLYPNNRKASFVLFDRAKIVVDVANSLIVFDRSNFKTKIKSLNKYEEQCQTRYLDYKIKKKIHFDIFLDVSSIEIFIDEGKKVMTGLVYPKQKDAYESTFIGNQFKNIVVKKIK